MAPSGGKLEGAIEIDLYSSHVWESTLVAEIANELRGGTHRSDRVRTRRPDSDLEDFKQAGLSSFSAHTHTRFLMFFMPSFLPLLPVAPPGGGFILPADVAGVSAIFGSVGFCRICSSHSRTKIGTMALSTKLFNAGFSLPPTNDRFSVFSPSLLLSRLPDRLSFRQQSGALLSSQSQRA